MIIIINNISSSNDNNNNNVNNYNINNIRTHRKNLWFGVSCAKRTKRRLMKLYVKTFKPKIIWLRSVWPTIGHT